MRTHLVSVFILIMFSFCFSHADVAVSDQFNAEQKVLIQNALESINKRAPKSFLDLISKNQIQINRAQGFSKSLIFKRDIVATAIGTTVTLNDNLFDIQFYNKNKSNIRHKDHVTFIAATLVHEIGHVLDVRALTDKENYFLKSNCTNQSNSFQTSAHDPNKETCQMLQQKKGQYSFNDQFIAASGWSLAPHPVRLNYKESTSPDIYEFQNLKESFAVNLEYFIFDEKFQCKKPTVYKILEKFFGEPQVISECDSDSVIYYTDDLGNIQILKKSQIQKVSYLLASEGEASMSKWGHAMLLLTVCPEGIDRTAVNCDSYIKNHVVVSPAALTYKGLSTIEGLNGTYDFKYFTTTLTNSIRDYNTVELRNLEVYDLKISRNEIINAVFDSYWNFSGKYFFISNNCSHGVLRTIKSLVELPHTKVSGFNPLELKNVLKQSGIIEQQPTHIYKANKARLESRNKALSSLKMNFDQFINTQFEKRMPIYDQLLNAGQLRISDLAVLEFAGISEKQQRLQEKLALSLLKIQKISNQDLKKIATASSGFIDANQETKDYGIPNLETGLFEYNRAKVAKHEIKKETIDTIKYEHQVLINEIEKSSTFYKTLLQKIVDSK